jgi:hypothetical protein
VLNPTAAQYPGGVPDGENVAFGNLVGNHIDQTLSVNLEAQMIYTLTVEIGRRADETFGGYRVQLRAGGELLAEDNSSQVPSAGVFVTSTVVYTSTEADTQLGLPLEIRLLPLGVQANFDVVRLEAIANCSDATWLSGPDMNEVRYGFPMVALPSGSWLAAGGIGGVGFLQTAEILDTGAMAWTPITPMPSAHRGKDHGTLLETGEVLIVGEDPHVGTHPHSTTAYRYDAGSGIWEMTSNNPNTDRFLSTTTLLPDGRVLLAGGYSGHSNGPTYATAEIYDPVTDSWSVAGTMAEVRADHTATLLTTGPNTGKVLVAGGVDRAPNNEATTGCEIYDPFTGLWSPTGSLNESRSGHTATLFPSGEILVTGGQFEISAGNRDSAEIYDPDTGVWSMAAPMTTTRTTHTATLLSSQTVLVVGGRFGGSGSPPLTAVEIYDPASDSWSLVESLSTPRIAHNAALLADGRVLVAGGLNDTGILFSTEVFTSDCTFTDGSIFADGFESGDTSAWSASSQTVSSPVTRALGR